MEVKILNVNRAKIENKLLLLGARKVFDEDIEMFFFDFEDGSIRKAKSVMRLRREGKKNMLTFKKIMCNQSVKIAEESAVKVSDLEIMKKILESIGLSVTGNMQKHRVSYQLDDTIFDFDCYKGELQYIPEFMEIEAANIETIYKYAKQLGFRVEDCLPWSINDLINHYKKSTDKTVTGTEVYPNK